MKKPKAKAFPRAIAPVPDAVDSDTAAITSQDDHSNASEVTQHFSIFQNDDDDDEVSADITADDRAMGTQKPNMLEIGPIATMRRTPSASSVGFGSHVSCNSPYAGKRPTNKKPLTLQPPPGLLTAQWKRHQHHQELLERKRPSCQLSPVADRR